MTLKQINKTYPNITFEKVLDSPYYVLFDSNQKANFFNQFCLGFIRHKGNGVYICNDTDLASSKLDEILQILGDYRKEYFFPMETHELYNSFREDARLDMKWSFILNKNHFKTRSYISNDYVNIIVNYFEPFVLNKEKTICKFLKNKSSWIQIEFENPKNVKENFNKILSFFHKNKLISDVYFSTLPSFDFVASKEIEFQLDSNKMKIEEVNKTNYILNELQDAKKQLETLIKKYSNL